MNESNRMWLKRVEYDPQIYRSGIRYYSGLGLSV
jgi:hypothetical protein